MTNDTSQALAELRGPTCSIPEAGRILGIGRNTAYEAAARGEIPVLCFGRVKRVPVAALRRMLEGDTGQAVEAA
jgi:excisionase family DNA binding protein